MDLPDKAHQYRPGDVGRFPANDYHVPELGDPLPFDESGAGRLMAKMLDDYVRAVLDQEHRVITAAVTLALVDGRCGVRLLYDMATSRLLSAIPDPAVPVGEIHAHQVEAPS